MEALQTKVVDVGPQALEDERGRIVEGRDGIDRVTRTLEGTKCVVRNMPPEIVSAIIKLSLPAPPSSAYQKRLRELRTVCSLWERTVTTTPTLWRSLYVSLEAFPLKRGIRGAIALMDEAIRSWFSRSGSNGRLTLTIGLGQSYPKLPNVIEWLRRCHLELETLRLVGLCNGTSATKLAPLFASQGGSSMSVLKNLDLDPPLYHTLVPDMDMGCAFPNLQSLILRSSSQVHGLPFLPIHASLSKLVIKGLDINNLGGMRSIANKFPALLEFGIIGPGHFHAQPLAPSTHKCLRSIMLSSHNVEGVFTGLSCPRLESLVFSRDIHLQDSDIKRIGELIQTSDSPRVTLFFRRHVKASLLDLLLSMAHPKVKTIELYCASSPDFAFASKQQLALSPSNWLRTLTRQEDENDDIPDDSSFESPQRGIVLSVSVSLDPSHVPVDESEEAARVRQWRHKFQKQLLSHKGLPNDEDMAHLSELLGVIEEFGGMTMEYLQFSKIGKIMRHIAELPDAKVPRDSEFKFRERAEALVRRWHQVPLPTLDEDDSLLCL